MAALPQPPDVPPAAANPIGCTIAGRYHIRELLARGGVGVVYLATDTTKNVDVVVKALSNRSNADEVAVARFEREAQRLKSVQHPNIVEMLDYCHEGGRSYLVMQYVRGKSLEDYVREREGISLEEFVPIAAQILKGVGYAHSRDMIIRDIKASNIMLCERKGRSNYVMILDFGLAKHLHGEAPITREHVMGTAGYVAPEALTRNAGGHGVDVYALGVLFWYMLAGAQPFVAKNDAAVVYQTVNDPVPSLAGVLGADWGSQPALMALIESCLAKAPEDRPADANVVIEQLIDSVPSNLFRLPRAPQYDATNRRPGEGNTGMIALTGVDPSGLFQMGSTGKLVRMKPAASATDKQPSVLQPAAKRRPRSRSWMWVAAGTVIGTAALLGVRSFGDDAAPGAAVEPAALLVTEPAPSVEPAAVVTAPRTRPEERPTAVVPGPPVRFEDEVEVPREVEVAPQAVASPPPRARSKNRRARPKSREPEAAVEAPPKPADPTPEPAPESPSPAEMEPKATPDSAPVVPVESRREGVFLAAEKPQRPETDALMHVD